jgi:GNAT superfamily N-acetyltransferase
VSAAADLEIRRMSSADEPAVLALLQESLGWRGDERDARYFAWKHSHNPLGPSPSWVAVDQGRIVGFRAFLRWEMEWEGRRVPAVRAVDTATHPDSRGRGVFSRLTLHALEELRAEGVAFAFNTPNDQSRPGYLKMGWRLLGRLPVLVRPGRGRSIVAMARARVPAEKWSVPTLVGTAAPEALADHRALADLLASLPPDHRTGTIRTPELLAWRYNFDPLEYRVAMSGSTLCDGCVVFRLRRRGPALEAVVCEVLVPGGNAATTRTMLHQVLARSGADYAIRLGGGQVPGLGFLRLPGYGPTLVWRPISEPRVPETGELRLTLGDVELL